MNNMHKKNKKDALLEIHAANEFHTSFYFILFDIL